MVEKKVVYTTSDGKEYKTESAANKHELKMKTLKELKKRGWTSEEFQAKIEAASERNQKLAALLKFNKKWENFPPHLIRNILEKSDIILDTSLVTKYLLERKVWGNIESELIAEERGTSFAEDDLYCKQESPWNDYKVKEIKQKNDFTKEVILEKKYDKYEIAVMKLSENFKLNSEEIATLLWSSTCEYEEKGENSRWSREVLSVVNIEGTLYAIEWSEGLTESQENEFYNQPYKVQLEEKDVIVKKTFVERV